MDQETKLDFLKNLARALAAQFGDSCEVLIHDLTTKDKAHTIAVIENGHVSHRQVGDGPSHVVLEALKKPPEEIQDQLAYLSQTHDGRILRSSTLFFRGAEKEVHYIFCINYDITQLIAAENALSVLTGSRLENKAPERIPQNVNELLGELIQQSVEKVGKPVALMNKEDKVLAIQYLNQTGAFLITRAGDRIARFFNISKYTLYNYLNE